MGENKKFFCLQVCLEYSKFAKGKGGKEKIALRKGKGLR